MYEYRNMTPQERAEVLAERKAARRSWHSPPHFDQQEGAFLITAACYEHRPVMADESRRSEWEAALVEGVDALVGVSLDAWVILPNHYHLLASGSLPRLALWLGRMHNGKSTQWNREDGKAGRKVWHRFADRAIRTDRHFYATLNYVHANAVKHRYATDAREWPWSSLAFYLDKYGRDALAQWWVEYPVKGYGRGWDD